MRRARTLLPALLLVTALAASACGDDGDSASDSTDDAGRADTVAGLIQSGEYPGDGEQRYRQSCASCHGGDGQGGIGPQLAGVVEAEYTPAEQAAIVLDGKGAMPAFGSPLGDDEIAAIVAYERTDLGED